MTKASLIAEINKVQLAAKEQGDHLKVIYLQDAKEELLCVN